MESQRLGDYIVCNPSVKLKKGQQCQLTDIDSITIGQKYPISKGLVIYDGQSGSKFSKGDTIMARITPCLENGKIAMYNGEEDSIGSTELFVFRGKEGVSTNEFVYYFFKQDWIRNYAANSMTGASGRQRADIKFIQKAKVQFPPLATQQKVASILSAYDSQIENNQKRIKLLEQMAENLYKEWFVRFRFPDYENAEFEGGVPMGWRCGKLKNIAQDSGKSEKKDNRDKYPAYVPIDCISSHSMVLGSMDSIENAESSLVSFKKTDILFGAMRPYFHKVIMAPFSGLTRSTCFVISPKNESYRYFLYLLLFQKSSIDYATTICVGSTMPYTVWKDFSRMPIVIPTENIVIRFAKLVKPIIDSIESIYFSNNYLVKQRNLLLPRLMSGKLSI